MVFVSPAANVSVSVFASSLFSTRSPAQLYKIHDTGTSCVSVVSFVIFAATRTVFVAEKAGGYDAKLYSAPFSVTLFLSNATPRST